MASTLTPRQTLQATLAALIGLLTIVVSGQIPSTAHAPSPTNIATRTEHEFAEWLNAERRDRGLAPLTVTNSLTEVAREHSRTMAASNQLTHSPDLGARLCCWHEVGETVAYGPLPEPIHDRLMGSASHRAILLDPDLREIGIGVVSDGTRLWVTHMMRMRTHS